MPIRLAMHVGVNRLDPAHYSGWRGELSGCEFDAHTMRSICENAGFTSAVLSNEKATRQAVLESIAKAASSLRHGDTFILTYSGHGSQLPDTIVDEPDGADETWCLYDGQLIDDELGRAWGRFEADVRVVLISDSCHSGSILWSTIFGARPEWLDGGDEGGPRPKVMPSEFWARVYQANKAFYDAILSQPRPTIPQCNVIQIAACADNQIAIDEPDGGKFTKMLKLVWANGAFHGTYAELTKAVRLKLPLPNSPRLETIGPTIAAFANGQAFSGS